MSTNAGHNQRDSLHHPGGQPSNDLARLLGPGLTDSFSSSSSSPANRYFPSNRSLVGQSSRISQDHTTVQPVQTDFYGNFQQQQSAQMQQSPSHWPAELSGSSPIQRDQAALLGSGPTQHQHDHGIGTASRQHSSNSDSSHSGASYPHGFPFQQQQNPIQQPLQHHFQHQQQQPSFKAHTASGCHGSSATAGTASAAAAGALPHVRHFTPPIASPSLSTLPGVSVASNGLSPAAEGSVQGSNVIGAGHFQQHTTPLSNDVLSSILSTSSGTMYGQWQPQHEHQPVPQRHYVEPDQHQQLHPVSSDLSLTSQVQHQQSYLTSQPSSTFLCPIPSNTSAQPFPPPQQHQFQPPTFSLPQPPQYQPLQFQQQLQHPPYSAQQQHPPLQYPSLMANPMVASPPMHHAQLVPSMPLVSSGAAGASRSSPAHQMMAARMSPPKTAGASTKRKQYFIFGPNSYSLMVRYLLMQEGLLQRDANTPKYPTVTEINTALQQDRRPIITKKRWSRLQGNLIVIPASQNTIPILLTPATQALTSAATPGVTVAPFIGHDDPHNLTHRLPRGRRLKSSGAGATPSHPPPPPGYSGLSIGGIGFPAAADPGASVPSPPAGAVAPPTFASQPMVAAAGNTSGFGSQQLSMHYEHHQLQQQPQQLPPSFGFADLGSGSDDEVDDDDDGDDPLADLGDEYAGPIGALPGGRPAHVPVPQHAAEALIQAYHLAWRGDTHLIVPRNMWPRIFRAAHQFVEHREDCPVIIAAAATPSGLPPANLMCNCVIRHRSLRDTLDAIKQHYQIRRSRCGITLAAVRRMFVQCTCCAVRGLSNV